MLPFDREGNYTPEEVKDALSGVNGSRQLTYRYGRLDQNNNYIGDINFVQSCTIENNSLADIKRTAKFKILDTGTINYLQDRIMPYVRLTMPKDETYRDHVRSLDPAVWWRMDDENKAPATTASAAVTDGNTLNTQAMALLIDPVKTTTISNIKTSAVDPNIRDEFWQYIEITDSEPLMFNVTAGTANTTEIYTAPALDGELTLVKTRQHTVNGFSPEYFRFPFPTRGFYFVKLTGENVVSNIPTIVTSRPSRLEDSSNNHIAALGLDLPLGGASLLNDNGTAYSATSGGKTWGANDLSIPLNGGLAINYWYKHTQTGTQNANLTADINTSSMRVNLNYIDQPASQSWIELKIYPKDGSVEDVEYSRVFDFDFAKFRNAPHMFTFVVAPDASTTTVYVDGVVEKVLTNTIKSTTFDHVTALSSDSIDSIEVDFSGSGTVSMDDVSIYTKSLTTTNVSKMYAMGVGPAAGNRPGYVDWPQGVFVLSSPTRTMEDGNVVTRDVDGYDQLVVLKEDSFDYRYSVKAGSKYTESILGVVQSTKAISSYPMTESHWSTFGSAVITSENSVRMDTIDAESAGAYSSMVTLKDIQVSARMDAPTSPSTARTIMGVAYYPDVNGPAKQLWIEKEGTNITFIYDGMGYVATWNAVNDAYWRMRESNGFFYFETSANRTTWVERRKIKLTDDTYADANVQFSAEHGQAVIGSGANEVSFTGRTKVAADVTKSESKLLTSMEWEPGTSKLTIINDLLSAINYQSATYSEGGTFLGKPYISPADRTPQYRYATDAESVITGDVDQTVDLFSVPNKWIVVVSDPDRPMLVGEYTNEDPHSPTSTVSRGRTIVDYRTEQAAPDQLTLDAQAARLAFEASQVYEAIEFDTAIMPIHQNNDVYELVIDGLGIDGKYSEVSWSMELKNGATMSHRVRRVVAV